jgi:peptide/nickel transport system permease protein
MVPPRGVSLEVHPLRMTRDPVTLQPIYAPDQSQTVSVRFFARGYPYKLFGLIPTDIHLIGTSGAPADTTLFILGTDEQGRDVFSRLVMATRTSLFIGLAGVALSVVIGLLLGGISGYYGGWADTIVQRLIEIVSSLPTIPLWMGLAAAVPRGWSIESTYFIITIIISLIGWTGLARVVRGRFLQVRHEDFVLAAELVGARPRRLIFVHMLPLFTSHIIASTTLAIPLMIIAETSLSFLGLGLHPPAVSWGVMLQQAQNVQSIANAPWMLLPVIPVVLAVLAFNFVGDGLRDAADPYD